MNKSQPPPQQQPLPQSIILGCNAFNCASKISNANWETKLNEQVNVNQGDSIGVKASFIDTRGTASGNIVLTKDTEISLEYYFYWSNTFNSCDPTGITTSSADLSTNLTQQVLVGQSIPYLYNHGAKDLSDNVPAYLTVADPSANFSITGINQADGLPYVVFQSSPSIPVPAIFGPVIPASQIVPGVEYVVNTAGISTNWEYAGIDCFKNVLPTGWTLNITPFTATANPNGITVPSANPFYDNPGMPTTDFLLPANVSPTLPYVTYMITELGNTDWIAIDPNLESTDISTNQMVAGTEYAIDNPGNINWTAFGAANNDTGTEFLYSPPPTAPPAFPITLNTAFFLANAVSFVNPGFPAFGASAGDTFQCVIDINGAGDYTLTSYSGSGQWCYDISSTAYWTLPPATFGVNTTVCPTATNLVISGFSATVGGPVPVAYLTAGDKYTVYGTGVLDQSTPPFTWNMVSNLPTTDTANMVAGNQYQVYEYTGTVISYAPNQGVLTDVFTSQGPIPSSGPYYPFLLYSTSSNPPTPNIFVTVSIVFDGGFPYTFTSSAVISLNVTRDANGDCVILPNSSIITDVAGFVQGVQEAITTINGPAQAGFPAINVSFLSSLANGDFSADFSSIINFPQDTFAGIVPYPGAASAPSLLVELQGQVPSTEVIVYNLNTPNIENIIEYYLTIEGSTKPEDLNPFSISISTDPSGSGLCYYVPYPVSISQGINPPGVNWTYNLPVNLAIQGPAGPGLPNFNLVFGVETCDSLNIFTCKLSPNSQVMFPTVLGSIPFIASGPYTGVASNSTATPLFGTLSAASVSGTGFLEGTVYNTPPKVGTIVQSLFPDPGAPPLPQLMLYNNGFGPETMTPNIYTVVQVYLDGVLFNMAAVPAQQMVVYLPIYADAQGNCYVGSTEYSAGMLMIQGAPPATQWLVGVTTVTTVINGPAYAGGPIINATFTSTGGDINLAEAQVLGFKPSPTTPYPFNPSTGRAAEYPSPFSVNNVVYDGTVRSYIPPTFKTEIFPVKKIWKTMLKAGSYDPNFLAETITRSMSRQRVKRVNNVTGGPFGTQSTLTVPTDSIYNTQTAAWADSGGSGQNTFFDSKNPKVYGFPSQPDYNINPDNDDMPFLFVPAMNSSYLHDAQPYTPPDYIYCEIPHPNPNGLNNIPDTNYYINLVPLISDVRSVSPTIPQDISGGYYTLLPFYSQNTVASGSTNGHGGIFPVAYGATQTSLLYNNEGNGLFSFNYLHSPILAFLSSASSDLTECTAHMFTTQKKSANMTGTNFFTTLIDKKSGILLKDMQPRSFWGSLGFDVDALTVNLDDKPPGFQMTMNEFESKTTGGFCGSSNIFNSQFHTKGSADQPNVPDTELLFLTGTVGPAQTTTIIPFTNQTPFMTIGTIYTINTVGTIKQLDGTTGEWDYQAAIDWSAVATPVNPNDNIQNVYSGMVITATGNWDGYNYTSNFIMPNQYYWATRQNGDSYASPSVLLQTGSGSTSTQLQNNYFEVQNTNTLNAVRIPTVRDQTGHFLISITGYNSIYIDDKSKHEIKSIVSSYFVSQGSFVAQVFPESYNYYHVGAPISISNLKIMILDPFTMEEAQIGPNSSVYIQVNKMLSDLAVQQVEN
jgi:hypothetical protein